jgi:hypothetical protein
MSSARLCGMRSRSGRPARRLAPTDQADPQEGLPAADSRRAVDTIAARRDGFFGRVREARSKEHFEVVFDRFKPST